MLKLWSYARATQNQRPEDSHILGWSSGHRLSHTEPESWATASVFQYAQALRKLVGIWTREEALRLLPVDSAEIPRDIGRSTLVARSATWTLGEGLTDRLFTLFVNPRIGEESGASTDPDNQPISRDYARSAILFGPPGASKTTMIRNLAAAIGWRYIELHSSHFVADGLPNVQKTADSIFRRLNELDHVVILFDEIDELVREREKEDEASGRFLTTSMLPKLAELWKNGKVLYFVATNHIEFFDKAITRAERFDAVWFVSPPSFDSKLDQLRVLLRKRLSKDIEFSLSKADVESALKQAVRRASEIREAARKQGNARGMDFPSPEGAEVLAKFMLLRWDELDELAVRICEIIGPSSSVDLGSMRNALGRVQDGRWRTLGEYLKFDEDQKYQRRDYGKANLWKIAPPIDPGLGLKFFERDGETYLVAAAEDVTEIAFSNVKVTRAGVATISLSRQP